MKKLGNYNIRFCAEHGRYTNSEGEFVCPTCKKEAEEKKKPLIKVNKYKVQTVEHFDNNDNSLGFLNEWENIDLRCQIAKQRVSGYYLMFNDSKILINPDGRIDDWQNGLFDTNEILLSRLFRTQRQIKS